MPSFGSKTIKVLTVYLLLGVVGHFAAADLVSFDVESRGDLPGDIVFGLAGRYEKVAGKVHFEVDPSNPSNLVIVDIQHAPRNARGMVEFSADFFLLKPKQIERGNGTLLVGIPNRGSKRLLTFFNHASAEGRKWDAPEPDDVSNLGDGFLMRQGWWHTDNGTGAQRLRRHGAGIRFHPGRP